MRFRELREFVDRHEKLFVLTGAGCSTASGIPDYRDAGGEWKRARPVLYQDFIADDAVRRRYWARSLVGWQSFMDAPPNDAHRALARLETQNRLDLLVTQNVDGLHQAAGNRRVVDLHGRLDVVRCLDCDSTLSRASVQKALAERNPRWLGCDALIAPDGDADIEFEDFSDFIIPVCPVCGGTMKPDVVFFGERIPPERAEKAMAATGQADAMLVVGSSLMVFSGYRLVRAMAEAGKPIACVNLGRTRADELLTLKVEQPCTEALAFLLG